MNGRQLSKGFASATLDALVAQICVLDAAGTVLMGNRSWGTLAPATEGFAAGVPVGANYLSVCDSAAGSERADGFAIAAGIRRVLGMQSSSFRHEFSMDSSAGPRRFMVTITGFREEGAGRAVVSRESIGDQFPAEQPVHVQRPVTEPARAASALPAVDTGNSLLAALPAETYQRLLGDLEPVKLTFGQVLFEPGMRIKHAYFPVNCLVALLTTVRGHRALEVGLVGHEGMVSTALALGLQESPARAVVEASGVAMRMDAQRFREEIMHCIPFQNALFRYTHALMAQIAQTAACNQFHSMEMRLARWLLMTCDRVRSNEFHLTQGLLGDMLGVRRIGITKAAGVLRKRKLIMYGRGDIKILDRKRLSAATCECYKVIKRFYGSA